MKCRFVHLLAGGEVRPQADDPDQPSRDRSLIRGKVRGEAEKGMRPALVITKQKMEGQ